MGPKAVASIVPLLTCGEPGVSGRHSPRRKPPRQVNQVPHALLESPSHVVQDLHRSCAARCSSKGWICCGCGPRDPPIRRDCRGTILRPGRTLRAPGVCPPVTGGSGTYATPSGTSSSVCESTICTLPGACRRLTICSHAIPGEIQPDAGGLWKPFQRNISSSSPPMASKEVPL